VVSGTAFARSGFTTLHRSPCPQTFQELGGKHVLRARPIRLHPACSPPISVLLLTASAISARNQFTGPSYFNTGLSITKNFKIPLWEGAQFGGWGTVFQYPESPALRPVRCGHRFPTFGSVIEFANQSVRFVLGGRCFAAANPATCEHHV